MVMCDEMDVGLALAVVVAGEEAAEGDVGFVLGVVLVSAGGEEGGAAGGIEGGQVVHANLDVNDGFGVEPGNGGAADVFRAGNHGADEVAKADDFGEVEIGPGGVVGCEVDVHGGEIIIDVKVTIMEGIKI